MTFSRGLVLGARVAAATGWGGSLVVLGLWLLTEGNGRLDYPRLSLLLGGLGAIAAGIVVFMVMVADRLIPSVGRRQSMWSVEIALCLIMFALLAGGVVSCRGAL